MERVVVIVKITHGDRFGGLMVYLAGPGREDEHTDQRVLAGDPALVAWYGGEHLGRDTALALARDLDADRVRTGTEVVSRRRRWDSERGDYVDAGQGQAHVWQCSLSLHPDEPALSDEQWAAIAHDFMERMGFDDPNDPREPARWVAVHHGRSVGGNDHLHLVANVVRPDGTRVAGYRDYRQASRAAHEIERKFGLRVVEGRGFSTAERAYTQGEDMAQRAVRREAGFAGAQVRDPDSLVRHAVHSKVRAAAAIAVDEGEFVRRLRQSGLQARPRFAQGTQDVVVGYSVRLPAAGEQQASPWFAGGKIAKDLSLRALREGKRWNASPEEAMEAAAEWRAADRGTKPVTQGRETRPPREADWRGWFARTDQVLTQLASGQDNPAAWAGAAREAAGALAAWSTRADAAAAGPLGRAARELSRSAWLTEHGDRTPATSSPAAQGLGDVAVLIAAAPGQKGRALDAALLAQVLRLAQAVSKAHASAGRAAEAARIERAVRTDLAQVRQGLPGIRSLAELDQQRPEPGPRAIRRPQRAAPGPVPHRGAYRPAPAPVRPDPERVVRPSPSPAPQIEHDHTKGRSR